MDLNRIQPEHMLPEDMQKANEYRFARAHIDKYIRDYLRAEQDVMEKVAEGVELVQAYMDGEYYESKMIRIEQIRHLNLEEMVFEIFVASAYCQVPELFTSFTAKIAGYLHFDDKEDSIKTIAELVAVLSDTEVFAVFKESKYASIQVESYITLPDKLGFYVENCSYLPPLVCKPKPLTRNRDTVHLTLPKESVILRKNHHEGDVCLDVLNICNATPLRLDVDFLCKVEELPNHKMETQEQQEEWDRMKKQSYEHYKLMVAQGNHFYLSHRYDKRGRIYAGGYHISTQSTPFKKACIELFEQEVVEGVPDHLRII